MKDRDAPGRTCGTYVLVPICLYLLHKEGGDCPLRPNRYVHIRAIIYLTNQRNVARMSSMMSQAKEPKTLQEAIVYFSDAHLCLAYLALRRWPDGVPLCTVCG